MPGSNEHRDTEKFEINLEKYNNFNTQYLLDLATERYVCMCEQ